MELTKYKQYLPRVREQNYAPRYDYQHVESVLAYQSFFSVPVGAQMARGSRTFADTNMVMPHQLPAGNEFVFTSIRVLFIPDYLQHRGRASKDEQDVKRMLLGGRLKLCINNRDYVDDGPLAKFPSCLPKTWMAELAYLTPDAEEAHWRAIFDPSYDRIAALHSYKITPLYLKSNQYFGVDILHASGPLNAPGKLGVILNGTLIRDA